MTKGEVVMALGKARLSGCDRTALAEGIVQDAVIEGDRVRVVLLDSIGGAPVPDARAEALRAAAAAVPGVAQAVAGRRPAGSVPGPRPRPPARARVILPVASGLFVPASKAGRACADLAAGLVRAAVSAA